MKSLISASTSFLLLFRLQTKVIRSRLFVEEVSHDALLFCVYV